LSRKIAIASLVLAALIAGTATVLLRISRVDSLLQSKYDNIAQLQSLPNESVRLQGVVTYADPFRKRFWFQDETGAVAIDSAPVGIEAGQVVRVDARTTRAYKTATPLPSVGLTDVRVSPTRHHGSLPDPVTLSLGNLLQKDTSGVRVQLTGVVHSFTKDESGLPVMAFGDSASEALARVLWRKLLRSCVTQG
jgi:hypothetical protein